MDYLGEGFMAPAVSIMVEHGRYGFEFTITVVVRDHKETDESVAGRVWSVATPIAACDPDYRLRCTSAVGVRLPGRILEAWVGAPR